VTQHSTEGQSKDVRPEGEPSKGKKDKKGIGELGPVWITAIAALITALTGAGFFVGRSTAPAPSSISHGTVTTTTEAATGRQVSSTQANEAYSGD
jgi:hypothetical protein